MRNYLKFLATAMVAVLLVCAVSVTSFAASTKFTDVDDHDETLSEAVALLSHLEVTKGTSETTFGTMESVTRQQMAAFVYRLLKPGKSIEGGTNSTSFTDLTDSTYFGYVSWANGMGIIKGTSKTTFNPKGGIMLQDAYTMIIRALGHEDETYQYPFTYIDKAEELGLDEGLDSAINYTTKLRRGDVAILLYNTFFAETGYEETKQVERLIGNGSKWVLETKTYYPTLAERVYDVEVGDFEVRATTRYAFNENAGSDEYKPLIDEFDGETLHLVAVEEDEPVREFYQAFDGTGLKGTADEYIMRSVKVYYTYEEDGSEKKVDHVYFMSGEHKTIETNSVSWSEVDANDADDYYGKDEDNYEKVEGCIVANNESIYLFDAPYSYLKPDYNSVTVDTEGLTAEEKKAAIEAARYELRNEKNLQLIDIRCLDYEKGLYEYYVDTAHPVGSAEEAMLNLHRVFSNGVYKIKFFDVDGDGIYEYAHYMPATYGFMDGDDGKYFSTAMEGNTFYKKDSNGSDVDLSYVPTIYYNDAVINGVEFKDGDFVVAYLNPEANIIEVMGVIKPYNGYISLVKLKNGQVKIDSTMFSCAYTYRAVEGFDDESQKSNYEKRFAEYKAHYFGNASTFPKLISNESVGEVFNLYAMKMPTGLNTIFYYDHLDDSTIAFEKDELIIPVSDEDNIDETYTRSEFDAKIGDTVYYVKAYMGDKITYIPVDVEEMYPEFDENYYVNGNYNISAVKGVDGRYAYVDKICKYTVDSDGLYTLIPLLHAEDEDGAYIGINRDSSTLVEEDNCEQYGNDLGYSEEGYIKKVAGSRYELVDSFGDSLLGDFTGTDANATTIKYFTMTAATRIVIKNTLSNEDNDVEYLEFDASTFAGSVETPLTNIQYILKGDPSSKSKADLVLLYAEAVDFEFETKSVKNSWRIVSDSGISSDAEGDYRNYYTLLNPYTGSVETDVPGENYKSKASQLDEAVANGTVVEIKGGMVDEDGDVLGPIDTSVSAGLVYITEYDEAEGYMGVVPVEAVDSAVEDGTICCRTALDKFVEEYVYDAVELNFDGEEFKTTVDETGSAVYGTALYYEITNNTVISVLKSDKAGVKAIEDGTFELGSISSISNPTKDDKCYNNKVVDRKGNLGFGYAEFVKAYVYTGEADGEDELPEAELIIIVVNGGEDLIFSDTDESFLPKDCDNH